MWLHCIACDWNFFNENERGYNSDANLYSSNDKENIHDINLKKIQIKSLIQIVIALLAYWFIKKQIWAYSQST